MRIHRRGCTAMAIGLVVSLPLAAQTSGRWDPRVPPAKPAPIRAVVKLEADDYNRLAEILMELAWLADPLTFPCRLEAHVNDTVLQVKGCVPNQKVRQRALDLARRYCPITVIDLLKQGEQGPVQLAFVPPPQLGRAAVTALQASFPQQPFKVECDGAGRVKVSGFVGSFEQKLAVSKSLRGLQGCSAVINDTHVTSNLSPAVVTKNGSPKSGAPKSGAPTAGSVAAPRELSAPTKVAAHPQPSLGQPYITHGIAILPDPDEFPVIRIGFLPN
jgi:hypothetical protein